MWRKQSEAGLSVIEILVIICAAVFIVFVGYWLNERLGRAADEPRIVRCASNLRQIAVAMNMYIYKFGDNKFYPVPAESFRGDCWLATLYWKEIIEEPKVFTCFVSGDDARLLPATRPADLSLASAIPDRAMSYAGLCKGLRGKYAHRNTTDFTERALSSPGSLPIACDKNGRKWIHRGGMNVVYFDGHVEFIPGDRAHTYDLIGAPGSEFEKLDGGEE